MEEWKEYKIGDLCKITSSKRIFAKEYKDSGVPFYRGKEIIEKQKGNKISTELYISQERYDEIKTKYGVPQSGDMLLTSVGTLGVPYIVKDETFYFKDGNLTWFYDFKGLDSQYLYYWFLSPIGKANINSKAIGSTQKALTIDTLSKFEISLPSLKTQQKIANILSSLDDKIEVNRRINEQLEELAQALFKSWFVDFEPFKDGEFVESAFVKLGDVVKTTSGGTPSRKHMEYYGGNHGWVKSKELNGTFIIDTEETITDDAIAKSSAKMLPAKSILIAMYGATVGQYAILSKPMTCNQAICALIPNDNYPYTYLFMFAKNKKEELVNKAVGSAQQNISQVLIKDLDVSNEMEKIKKFHSLVNPMFETIEKNQQEITHLTNLRDTLLPKLMSGEIDVEQFNVIE